MGDIQNPWVAAAAAATGAETSEPTPAEVSAPVAVPTVGAPTGVAAPLSNLVPPDAADRFGQRIAATTGQLWLVSTHGGAGSSTLGAVFDLPAVTRAWPYANGASVDVLLVCRSNLHGLETARMAAREWASAEWAAVNLPGVQVRGLVVVADAPGRTPKPLRQLEEHVSGAVPYVWRVPWHEPLRTSPVSRELAEGPWKQFAQQIHVLRTQGTDE